MYDHLNALMTFPSAYKDLMENALSLVKYKEKEEAKRDTLKRARWRPDEREGGEEGEMFSSLLSGEIEKAHHHKILRGCGYSSVYPVCLLQWKDQCHFLKLTFSTFNGCFFHLSLTYLKLKGSRTHQWRKHFVDTIRDIVSQPF